MRRFVAILAAFAMSGALSIGVSAAQPRADVGSPLSAGGDQQDRRKTIDQLKAELQRLMRDLKQHEDALKAARRANDRAAAERITKEIRTIKAQIQQIQQQLRRAGKDRK
jgi:chromosome segregation ATPase